MISADIVHTPAATAVLAAQPGTCRFPIAHASEFRFCGEPVAVRTVGGMRKRISYCSHCAATAFTHDGFQRLKLEAQS